MTPDAAARIAMGRQAAAALLRLAGRQTDPASKAWVETVATLHQEGVDSATDATDSN